MEKKKHKYSEQEAYIKLSALCAVAEYCVCDMRKKMSNWELPEGAEDRIVHKLVSEKFVDEERFAHAFVRDKFRYNRWGRVRIAQELRKKHIDANTIEDALEEIDEGDNLDTLRELINKKRPSVKGKSEYEIRGKLIRFAIGRGFSMSDAVKVIGDLDEI